MSVFTNLPQDILQHEITHFLDYRDSLSFNEVLRRNERVYKKLPADYALKHALKTKRLHFETIVTRLNLLLHQLGCSTAFGFDAESHRWAALATTELKKVFAFLKDPLNSFIFMYLHGLKGKMSRMVDHWMADDMELYEFLSDGGAELRALATETRDYITSVAFVRHVSTVDHQSVF
jgi:hypothetical protein